MENLTKNQVSTSPRWTEYMVISYDIIWHKHDIILIQNGQFPKDTHELGLLLDHDLIFFKGIKDEEDAIFYSRHEMKMNRLYRWLQFQDTFTTAYSGAGLMRTISLQLISAKCYNVTLN